MTSSAERRLLQIVVAIACLVPLLTGGSGMVRGPAMLHGVSAPTPIDLDSHFRYLSGLLLGIGLAFLSCIGRIEQRGRLFGTLALVVFVGGLGRLLSLSGHGPPGPGHLFGLAMELGAVPLLFLWQRRIARRCAAGAGELP